MGNNEQKNAQLGMPYGTANSKLRKMVLFDLLKRHGENICCRCNEPIEQIEELSMDHIEPWLGSDTALFWDVNNIAFAHAVCNNRAGRRALSPHGTTRSYEKNGCRCQECTKAHRLAMRRWRAKK